MNFLELTQEVGLYVRENIYISSNIFQGMIKIPLDELEEKETTDTEQSASNKNKETQTKEIQLNDQVFEQLQDLNVNNVAFKLREIVDELKVEEQVHLNLYLAIY